MRDSVSQLATIMAMQIDRTHRGLGSVNVNLLSVRTLLMMCTRLTGRTDYCLTRSLARLYAHWLVVTKQLAND